MSLGNTMLQLFCCYYSWCLYRQFQCWIYCAFTLVLSEICVQCPIWLFSVVLLLLLLLLLLVVVVVLLFSSLFTCRSNSLFSNHKIKAKEQTYLVSITYIRAQIWTTWKKWYVVYCKSNIEVRSCEHCRLRKAIKHYIFWVCVCSLSYSAWTAPAPCYIVVCGFSGSTTFSDIISYKNILFEKKN